MFSISASILMPASAFIVASAYRRSVPMKMAGVDTTSSSPRRLMMSLISAAIFLYVEILKLLLPSLTAPSSASRFGVMLVSILEVKSRLSSRPSNGDTALVAFTYASTTA